jgi:hypothetical protein
VGKQRDDEFTDEVVLVVVDLETTDKAEDSELCLVERKDVINRERVDRLRGKCVERRSSSIESVKNGKLIVDGSPDEGIKGIDDRPKREALSLQSRDEVPRTELTEGFSSDGWESGWWRDDGRVHPVQSCSSPG